MAGCRGCWRQGCDRPGEPGADAARDDTQWPTPASRDYPNSQESQEARTIHGGAGYPISWSTFLHPVLSDPRWPAISQPPGPCAGA